MLALVKGFAGGRVPTGCWSCWLGCRARGEAGQPGPFFLPPIPGSYSALTINIYTELASGGPSWNQDPAVLATDCHWGVVITADGLWCERRGDSTGKGSFTIVTLGMGHGDPERQTCPGPHGKLWLRWAPFLGVRFVGARCRNVDDFCPLEGRRYLRWVGVPKASVGTPLSFSSRGRTLWEGVWS